MNTYMHMDEWVASLLDSRQRKVIPIMTHPGIELAGKKVIEAVTDGKTHADAIRLLNDRYPADAVTAIMDLTVEAEAFGASITFPEDEVPSVIGRLLADSESVHSLEVPSLSVGRIPEYLKANTLVAEAITDKPVFAGCIGPFSLAGRLFDLSEMMMALYIEPDTIKLLLEKCTRFLMDYCQAIKATGVNGVIMAEPAAGLVSNDDCMNYSSQYVRQIVQAVQDDRFMVVLHNCGNSGHCTEAMIASGAKGLHFGNKADMVEALAQCPQDLLVMGNLDPVGLLKQSTSEEVAAATHDLLSRTASSKNFILSTGCDVPPHIPFENIEALYDAVKKYT